MYERKVVAPMTVAYTVVDKLDEELETLLDDAFDNGPWMRAGT